MYVILRPGPYVCAEWEMGGLPWWLLKKEEIQLRTQDPYFMERVRLFMAEVGRQLRDLQLAKGGNILMVQVENEYGAYGIDKPYITAIRDMVKTSGFDQSTLFQCDWNSNFENNNQGWGSILYRTQLKESNVPQFIRVTEAHDWAQVYIDGKRTGVLNRLKGEGSLPLPPVREGAVLDILVEAMGRGNFGKGIYDWKGITGKVEIINEQGAVELKNWEVYSFLVDYTFAGNKDYRKSLPDENQPAYYRSSFTLAKTGDTFLEYWTPTANACPANTGKSFMPTVKKPTMRIILQATFSTCRNQRFGIHPTRL